MTEEKEPTGAEIITKNLRTGEQKRWPGSRSRAFTADELAQQKQLKRAAAYHFRAHASRIAHETDVFVRTLSDDDAPKLRKTTLGFANYSSNSIVLTSPFLDSETEMTLFHELWHIVSKHDLTKEQREIVYDELQAGERWHTSYLDKSEERAARAFAAYASARAHGLKLSPARAGTAQEIYEAVYAGEIDELEQRKETENRPFIERPAFLVGLITCSVGLAAFVRLLMQ